MEKQLTTHVLGYPRIGARRELKWALEKFWKKEISEQTLDATAKELRIKNWQEQLNADLDWISVNDFSFYDQILDTICLLGAVPTRYGKKTEKVSKELYFSMARGSATQPALAMTKWFDTNYHYLVPEINSNTEFSLNSDKIHREIEEAKTLTDNIKVTLIGPVTFLTLATSSTGEKDNIDQLERLDEVQSIYAKLLTELEEKGIKWVQIDEPIFSSDLSPKQEEGLKRVYQELSTKCSSLKILVSSYFGSLEGNLELFEQLPVDGLHIDTVSSSTEAHYLLSAWDTKKVLSLGIIDGRNIWASDLKKKKEWIETALKKVPRENLWLASSCSLLHVPYSLQEEELSADIKQFLAFAKEKLSEIKQLSYVGTKDEDLVVIEKSAALYHTRVTATFAFNKELRNRCQNHLSPKKSKRIPYNDRKSIQRKRFNLPQFPTTTIGSFPQTQEIRATRSAYKKGKIAKAEYESAILREIKSCVKTQEDLGLDVLVHGEFERNDMVEFFADSLDGYAFSKYGWVQSYGSRCVKPPIVYGEVSRNKSLSGAWISSAQSFTKKPVKGMLSGPITMLKWSFVRDDIPLENIANQVALALREELQALEAEGCQMIQVDEPALREALPLRKSKKQHFLNWATKAFRIATSGVSPATQIHTHMCYGKFGDIYEAIVALDADVISIEATRNHLAILETLVENFYPNEIGIGIWDIHSPRVPPKEEFVNLLTKACSIADIDRVWVNPDCGLKTREWKETKLSLANLVSAAKTHREKYSKDQLLTSH